MLAIYSQVVTASSLSSNSQRKPNRKSPQYLQQRHWLNPNSLLSHPNLNQPNQ